jgi:hypothetical protein
MGDVSTDRRVYLTSTTLIKRGFFMREKYPLSSFLTKLIFPKYEEGKKVTGDMENILKTY